MKLTKTFSMILATLAYLAYGTANAADSYVECFDCTYSQKVAVAKSEAYPYFQAMGGGRYRIHVIDIARRLITSFQIWEIDGVISVSTYATPSDVESYMSDLRNDINELNLAAKSVTIPTTVMVNAWDYTNCRYCKNNVTQYLQNTLEGKINEATQSVIALAQAFNLVNTNLPNQYSFPLESGGRIIVELGLSAESDLTLVVVDVIDESNNSVPTTVQSLKDAKIFLGSGQAATTINSFINIFNYYVPKGVTGTVTIRDCPSSGCITDQD
tara:strand:+ start:5367 stop:6176 length:810 start_codon:yes stop_codon:yes gene_type:complete